MRARSGIIVWTLATLILGLTSCVEPTPAKGAGEIAPSEWRVIEGPFEDGSLVIEFRGARIGACLEDALCDDGRLEFPKP